jgi:tRNA(Arg) A34 adenosine deaminase TadA
MTRSQENPVDHADERHLSRAIELAVEARANGNPPFGSLLVDARGEILAEEQNTTLTDRDITAHPELKLARWAAMELPESVATTVTMFTSCEPCPMCSNAIARARLARVVFALSNDQLQALKPAGFVNPDSAEVSYDGPALEKRARAAVDGYY